MFSMFGIGPAELVVLAIMFVLLSSPLLIGGVIAWFVYRAKRGPDVCPHCGAKLRQP